MQRPPLGCCLLFFIVCRTHHPPIHISAVRPQPTLRKVGRGGKNQAGDLSAVFGGAEPKPEAENISVKIAAEPMTS